MESDTREPRRGTAGTTSGEKSPAGSVKRARERAAAGLPPERPQIPPYPTPLSVKTSPGRSPQQGTSPTERPRYPQYPTPTQGSRQGQGPSASVPLVSSRPRKGPASPVSPQDYTQVSPLQERNVGRGPPPQRPPRPNFVPPMLQSSDYRGNNPQPPPLQYRKPQGQEQPSRNYWEDSYLDSSSSSRPLTTSTTSTGTASSAGSIPDFPSIPAMPPIPPMLTYQPPPRRNLGPPPSARKGGSSYYSQTSFVPPIPEEMSETRSSYASSHFIPESWNDGPPEYYMGSGIDEEDEEDVPGGNSGRGSSAGDHDDASGLVRKGGGIPRTMPLDTVESGDESDRGPRGMQELDWQARQDERWRPGFGGTADTDPIGRHDFRANARLHPYSGYESDATFLDSPTGESPMPRALKTKDVPASNAYFGTPSSTGSPVDPRVDQILGHLEKGGALAASGTASPSQAASTPGKGTKRPPNLNLKASKEGRDSATSLPELIRRATKLASNLDRGKTASRLGMLDMLNAKEKESREKAGKGSRTGSISDILAAFPSPSPTTPTGQRPSGWPTPSPHGKSNLSRAQTVNYGSSTGHKRGRRRCCGMPIWAFILLLIILLLLIAAAVIIPITLIVLPRQHKSSSPTLASCQTSSPCGNGGTNVLIDKACRCVCANGYTGSTCNTAGDSSCTTSDVPVTGTTEVYKNATLGSSIPRLLTAAESNYSIQIDSYTLLSLFSVSNLSCSSENALVTFNSQSQRRDLDLPLLSFEGHSHQRPRTLDLEEVIAPPTRTHHQPSPILWARGAAQTSENIVFAAPTGDTPAAATSSAAVPTGDEKMITSTVLDFARTAILFIFQETSSLDSTTTALNKLQTTLANGKTFDASDTSAGGNITVDLSALTVGFGNGTLYGGKGAGAKS
ncbi:hypothetical protein IMSHALPRED_009096 [Imshaugia aleurites]|uniref:EGF-like domain-containing protein n=1 Tax=Imshaugia aleurites TaxID=172621 RepID=A0A8H3FVW8_9LECA|nr:hypothetical protein IMSHALPRED_009096 [Imshaugia aleurites]